MKLINVPISQKEAKVFVANFHRHNKPPVGSVFQIGASWAGQLVGVVMAGRPVSRHEDTGQTIEIIRCCVVDNAPKNTCSFLYGKARKAAHALGFTRVITYSVKSEGGASLRGAGFRVIADVRNNKNGWGAGKEWQPIYGQLKIKWEG